MIKTNLQRFGETSPTKNKKIKQKILNKNKTKRFNEISNNLPINYTLLDINDKFIYKIKCDNGHIFEINSNLFYNRLKVYNTELCTVCNPLNKCSGKETQLLDFIKENYVGDIITNKRTILDSKYELDIYLPELNLAFEFNGLYWHNELHKEKYYHKDKSGLCDEKGIQLIHIWEDDWNYKQDIIKSMILNKLNKSTNRVYARKCEIREIVDNKIVRLFLDNNHIQGFVGSSIKIGLYYNNELVSLMTFGKKRVSQNSKSKSESEYELLRFCNKLNTNIIGGASRLFKYFTKNYNFSEIITYADRSYSNGNLYKTLGFNFVHITEPNYYYTIGGIRKHRFGFRKDVLVKEGYDKEKSEHEIMLERKIYRIYNAGNYKYVYKN